MGRYWRPRSLHEALAIRAGESVRCIAGATDVLPARAAAAAWDAPPAEDWLDLSAVASLAALEARGGHWRIGAAVTWARLRDAHHLPPGFRALREAAAQVGGRQVQARGTIGGNLCNASPAADGAPPLLLLDAAVELASARGLRVLPLRDFLRGNRRTALAPTEILTAIHVPARRAAVPTAFVKLGARRHLVISIAAAAADAEGRAVVGACSEVPREWAEDLSPISDPRGSAAYRLAAAPVLVARARQRARAA